MTDSFMEAVRAALESLLLQQQGEDSPNPETWDSGYAAHLATYLAPRVAAAIEAAGVSDWREEPDFPHGYRQAALAALRGTPAP